MKSTRKLESSGKSVSIKFDKFPVDGDDTMTMTEWESGEGCDIVTSMGKIEMTHEEMAAFVALYGQFHMLEQAK